MTIPEPSFTIGIEEEYLLVDRQTRDLAVDPPEDLLSTCEKELEGRVSPEFLRCQIEVGTPVCDSVQMAREELGHLRKTIGGIANQHGLAPIAASTHPFAQWRDQHHTDKERYNVLARDMQGVVRRMLICGMHVHVAIEDDALRNDITSQASYFLPHLLALSTSSPFWQGLDTGLKSYRLSVFHAMPRTGLPERFDSYDEYDRTVKVLVKAGMIEDATKIWWDLRPSGRFPTLEMRITDICTRLDDALTIAAIFQCLCRMLWRLRRNNQRWRYYSNFLIDENRWLAQRFGVDAKLIDYGRGECVPYVELADEIIALLREDAEFLGCIEDLERARDIARHGTSADRQIKLYRDAIEDGVSQEDAMKAVVDHLIAETAVV